MMADRSGSFPIVDQTSLLEWNTVDLDICEASLNELAGDAFRDVVIRTSLCDRRAIELSFHRHHPDPSLRSPDRCGAATT
jgi:hypothetical protein